MEHFTPAADEFDLAALAAIVGDELADQLAGRLFEGTGGIAPVTIPILSSTTVGG